MKQSRDVLLHTGYDYREQVLRRTMSKQMFRTNETLTGFLDRIGEVIYDLIENVKRIKTFANPALDRNERRLI
jgi:hypothetical protein